ncbi:MAG: histidine phosphatase family protein [Candidatus Nanopelagicales bacterium]|nr:histidine phosphatase family protein [Actinomycetes bacterium]MCH9839566.1 histidine phosphatase family protein [Actinomycetes bacterium]
MTLSRKVVFWRHGRTEWNAQRRFQGQTDIPLDEVGLEQASDAARLLVGVRPTRIISSDLSRAASTASALAELVNLDVRTFAGLRETNAGTWEGQTREALIANHGDELAAWAAGSNLRPGGGETRTEVAQRVINVINDELTTISERETLVVVTHGGSARAAIAMMMELPPEHWAALGVLSNCAWSVLSEKDSQFGPAWRLQEYNAKSLPVPALGDDR